jgi:DNA-binding NarL/FixJ family response regulator
MKLLLVCEYAFIRESLCNLLQDFAEGLKIIGTPDATGAAREMMQSPDIELLLYYLTDKDTGLMNIRAINLAHPDIPVLVVADFSCDGDGSEFIDAGARGCVSTEFTWQAIKSIMQRVVKHETISPHDSQLINESYKILYPESDAQPAAADANSAKLTPRQLEVLSLIKEGRSNKEIARSLNMAEATVKTHCSAIFRELGVDNRTQAAMAAEQIV